MPKVIRVLLLSCIVLVIAWKPSVAGNNSGAAFSTWPDTGQTKCYNNTVEIPCPAEGQSFYGQDAQYSGPVRSYTVLGGGTMIRDNVTGLIWEEKNNIDDVEDYSNPHDIDNFYSWCDTNPDTNGGFAGYCGDHNTEDFINQLNTFSFSGYNDWRLPTIKELATLADLSRYSRAIDPVFGGNRGYSYWSSTSLANDSSNAYFIELENGTISWGVEKAIDPPIPLSVRAVRGSKTTTANRYSDNGDGSVSDTVTCLQWQKATMDITGDGYPDNLSWQQALSAAAVLDLAGHTDWRLPDRNELRSLVDYSYQNLTIDPIFQDTTLSSWYWSSTTAVISTGRSAWVLRFDDGIGRYYPKNFSPLNARAVRGEQCGSYNLSLTFEGTTFDSIGGGEVNMNPPDSNCTSDCTETYEAGTTVTLTASAFSSSWFAGWTGACSGTDSCQVTMDESKSVTAIFNVDGSNEQYATRALSKTKYGETNSFNYDNEWPNDKEDDVWVSTTTHALYPFQIGTMSGDFDGYKWRYNGLNLETAIKREEEDNRQPLILIHGWQAKKYDDYLNRDPEELAKAPEENHFDAEGYWWTFLRYFSTNEDLKDRYKIYLYQYPSYKHITFNARVLSNMLYEVEYIRNWVGADKKITILAHSMGGLVARSMLEEHDGIWIRWGDEWNWNHYKSGAELLDRLITLDTPHHGSPAAVYPWIDVAPLIGKDVFSPGALDLWWDGYPGAFSAIEAEDLLSVGDFSGMNIDNLNSWREQSESEFDKLYRDQIPDYPDPREIEGGESVTPVIFYTRPNPWLTFLNTVKHVNETWENKYIFYGGYNDGPLGDYPGDKLIPTGLYELGDDGWVTGVWVAGYLNDSPVPVTSSFFDTVGTDCVNNLESCCEDGILSSEENSCEVVNGWPETNQIGMFWEELVWNDEKNILKTTTEEGFQIRFFKDYHHDRMLHGAYVHPPPARGENTPETPPTCSERNVWKWDLISNHELVAPCKNGDEWQPRPVYSGFRTPQFRMDYIKDTGVCITLNDLTVFNTDTSKDTTWKSTLEYEPLFLMLEKDLLPSVSRGSCFSWATFYPAILLPAIINRVNPPPDRQNDN